MRYQEAQHIDYIIDWGYFDQKTVSINMSVFQQLVQDALSWCRYSHRINCRQNGYEWMHPPVNGIVSKTAEAVCTPSAEKSIESNGGPSTESPGKLMTNKEDESV